MKLDKHVVDMFTELTKPADDVKMEKTCYGTISVVDGTRYVKLDGSDLLVPAASTVKTSHGDRVTVLMKNHSLTVTGNLTAPATDGEGGSSGEAGTAATIEVGTVTTGEAGSSASVTNSGTTSAAVFDFVIPKGDKGEKGDVGPQGPQGEKGDTGTWDGTIPDHEHTVSDITDFPTSLPANGGNADTIDGKHASEFMQWLGITNDTDFMNDANHKVDYHCNISDGTLIGLPMANWYHIVYYMHSYSNGYGMQIAYPLSFDGATFIRRSDGITWTNWKNVADGGNAETVGGKHASDFYQVASGLRTNAVYSDIFSTTLSAIHACWNKWCFVVGSSIDSSSSDYIDNAPETTNALWYEVFTGGIGNRAFQIAIGCFAHQRKTFIRYKHDEVWSEWYNIADGGNADTVDGKHASNFIGGGYIYPSFIQQDTLETDLDNYIDDYHGFVYNCTNSPVNMDYGFLDVFHFSGYGFAPSSLDVNGVVLQRFTRVDLNTFIRLKYNGSWTSWHNLADGGNADTLDGKHASDFLYANGFAGQLAKLFSRPANDNELATLFSVVPDDATLDSLNPGIYVVNSSAARRSLGIPNEISQGGPNGSTIDNLQCVGGILIKLGSILGKPGIYSTTRGQAIDRPRTTSCAFFISNNGSIYRAIESIGQSIAPTGETYLSSSWTWVAFVFDSFSNTDAYTIQHIKYINNDVTLAPGEFYEMYHTRGQFVLPYTHGTAYGPTKSFYLKRPSTSNPNLCIVNTSGTKNLIIPAGRYLIHVN